MSRYWYEVLLQIKERHFIKKKYFNILKTKTKPLKASFIRIVAISMT